MAETITSEVRAFNRFYTRQIGLLDEHIAKSPFSLAEARVLYEIAARGRTTAAELARDLGLDRGYLSRMLQKFAAMELSAMSPTPGDRRQNQLALTREGDAAVAALNGNSEAAVEEMLHLLGPAEREKLRSAMTTIRRLLGDRMPEAPLILRPHRLGELGWLVHRQGLLYNQQFGWNGAFESLIAGLYREFAEAPDSPPKALWIAERNQTIVGSVFVIPAAGHEATAQLRMLYVEPEARGQGLGRVLVDQVVSFSREHGYRRVRLWTQSVLESARRIYAGAGFALIESTPHHSFGKDLVGEVWELEL